MRGKSPTTKMAVVAKENTDSAIRAYPGQGEFEFFNSCLVGERDRENTNFESIFGEYPRYLNKSR